MALSAYRSIIAMIVATCSGNSPCHGIRGRQIDHNRSSAIEPRAAFPLLIWWKIHTHHGAAVALGRRLMLDAAG
jgi:hypothetical protein